MGKQIIITCDRCGELAGDKYYEPSFSGHWRDKRGKNVNFANIYSKDNDSTNYILCAPCFDLIKPALKAILQIRAEDK